MIKAVGMSQSGIKRMVAFESYSMEYMLPYLVEP